MYTFAIRIALVHAVAVVSMTLTFALDLDSVKLNQHAKYLGQRSFSSKVIVRIDTHKHTHPTDCSALTTKEVRINISAYRAPAVFRSIDTKLSLNVTVPMINVAVRRGYLCRWSVVPGARRITQQHIPALTSPIYSQVRLTLLSEELCVNK